MQQINTVVPPSMAERRAELGVEGAGKIPRAWEETVAACLAKTPEERPQSVAAVWQALTGRVLLGSVAKRGRSVAKVKKGGSGKKALVFATVVVLAAGAVAGWWYGVEAPRRAAVGLAEVAKVEVRQEGESKAQRAQADEAAAKERVAELYGNMASAGSDELRKKTIYEQVLELEPGSGQALRELGRIDALRGSVEVVTEPEGAELRLIGAAGEQQGKEVGKGKSPAKLDGLALGGYSLQVDAAGFETVRREVSVLNGDAQKVEVALKRSVGSLAIHSTPPGMRYELKRVGSEVADYDGAFAAREGVTPKVLEDLPTGKYEVVMRREGWPEYRKQYAVGRGVETAADWLFGETTLTITTEPPAKQIQFKGELINASEMSARKVPSGTYEVGAVYAEGIEKKMSVKLEPGTSREFVFRRDLHIVPTAFGTIQAAIDAAQPGDQVIVKKGTYRESLKFKSGIHLVGEDREATIVEYPATHDFNLPLLIQNCESGIVENLSFRQIQKDEDNNRPSVVGIYDSNVLIKDCAISNVAGHGVSVAGGISTFTGCHIFAAEWGGIWANSGDQEMTMPDGSLGTESVESSTTLTVIDCQIKNCGNFGIIVKQVKASIVGNSLEGNGYKKENATGIMVTGGSGEIKNNTVINSNGWGIFVNDGFVGSLRENSCRGNKFGGIGARGADTEPSIIGNKCSGNRGGYDISIEKTTYPTAFLGNTGSVNRSATWPK